MVGAFGGWALSELRVTTDITHFLPDGGDQELAELSRAIAGSDLNRTITLTIEGGERDRSAAAARRLGERLAESSQVAWVRFGPDEALQQAFYEAYYPARFSFLAESSAAREMLLSDAGLRQRVAELRERLGQPTGTFVREIAPGDPLLLFLNQLERLRASQQGELDVHQGAFVTADGSHGIVLLASQDSPFQSAAHAPLQEDIATAFREVQDELGEELQLEQSGVHRFAMASEASIKADVSRVSIAGTVGVLLFLLLLFRSVRYLLLGNVPIALGVLGGIGATVLAFETIHGLTLAFGATLIGVAIDYVAHYLNHHTLAPAENPTASMRRIWAGLLLGALTTVAGLAGLAWTSFPGVREMAVFTSVGVLIALLATRWVMPPFMPEEPVPTKLHRRIADAVERGFRALELRRRFLWILPIGGLLVSAAGLLTLDWQDDIRALNAMDADLLAEDERVRERVAKVDSGRFVVAVGNTEGEALERNDAVHEALREAASEGLLARQRSLHPLLYSPSLQRANHEALSADVRERIDGALAEAQFLPEMFGDFAEAHGEGPRILTFSDLADSPIATLVRPFRVELGDRVAILTFVSGVSDEEAVRARVEAIDGVRWFDQGSFLARAYAGFRVRTLEMVAVGLVLVFFMVAVRYRSLRLALAAFAPALLAAVVTLALVALLGFAANLLHVVTLLLVLSMGVDYGVFMVESRTHEEGPTPTIMSLLVACFSTILSFGALAMSQNAAMQAMGLTAAIGVALSLVLAPIAWLLLRRPSPER